VRRQRFRPLHGGDPMPNGVLYLLEGAHLDLAHALARDAEFLPSCTDCGDFGDRLRRAFGISSRFGEFMRGFGDTRSE
jgi:hypothetical protein